MSETLYVEGPDLTELLEAIELEHGPAAHVVAVNRARRGGVLGFFPQEIYAITYELTDAADVGLENEDSRTDQAMPAATPLTIAATEIAAPVEAVAPNFNAAAYVAAAAYGRHASSARHSAPDEPAEPIQSLAPATVGTDSMSMLLEQADSFDGPRTSHEPAPQDDFARFLAAAAQPVASPLPALLPTAAPATSTAPVTSAAAPREPITEVFPPETRFGDGSGSTVPARARLGMIAALRDVGVPVPMTPDSGETSLYRAVEQVIEQLPAAPPPPQRAGEILALVGPRERCLPVAELLSAQLHVPLESSWIVDHTATPGSPQVITGPRDAAQRGNLLRTGDVVSIVIVDTHADDGLVGGEVPWCAQILAALQPTAVWAVVDATRKTADMRAELDRLGPIQALAVHSVTRTSSPATVWDTDIPVALLDGRPATTGAWAALLFDAMRTPTAHHASMG